MSLSNFSSTRLVGWIVLLLGLFAAMLLGQAVGISDMRKVAAVLALVPLMVIFVSLKENIWVLIPIGWYFSGTFPWLPIPLPVRYLFSVVPILVSVLFIALRVIPWKRKLGALDYLILINLAYLATVYFRNPAGVWWLQTEIVGGRPYADIVLAYCAYLVLSHSKPTTFIARIFPLFFLVPTAINALLDIVVRFIPQVAYPIAMIYSGVSAASSVGAGRTETIIGETRMTGLKDIGQIGALALCSKFKPITLVSPFYPFRGLLFAVSLAAIFLSGFRSTLLFAMITFVLATVLRKRMRDLWLAFGLLILGLVLLVSLQNTGFKLPHAMQRTLSWLPGDWNVETVEDAERSSRWRWEMVEWALNDERILRNKIWGQGFGLTRDDMNIIAEALTSNQNYGGGFIGGSDREMFIVTGTFHNGPISAVRYVGVVGLAFYLMLIFNLALSAWRLCLKTEGTEAFSLALFVGIPVIYFPFAFIVLTGFYEVDLPNSIFSAGLLNLTSNYLSGLHARSSAKSDSTS